MSVAGPSLAHHGRRGAAESTPRNQALQALETPRVCGRSSRAVWGCIDRAPAVEASPTRARSRVSGGAPRELSALRGDRLAGRLRGARPRRARDARLRNAPSPMSAKDRPSWASASFGPARNDRVVLHERTPPDRPARAARVASPTRFSSASGSARRPERYACSAPARLPCDNWTRPSACHAAGSLGSRRTRLAQARLGPVELAPASGPQASGQGTERVRGRQLGGAIVGGERLVVAVGHLERVPQLDQRDGAVRPELLRQQRHLRLRPRRADHANASTRMSSRRSAHRARMLCEVGAQQRCSLRPRAPCPSAWSRAAAATPPDPAQRRQHAQAQQQQQPREHPPAMLPLGPSRRAGSRRA